MSSFLRGLKTRSCKFCQLQSTVQLLNCEWNVELLKNFKHRNDVICVGFLKGTVWHFWKRTEYSTFPSGSEVKNLPAMQELQETQIQSLGWEDPLVEEMATHSSILAWKMRWTEDRPAIVHGVTKSQTQLSDKGHTHWEQGGCRETRWKACNPVKDCGDLGQSSSCAGGRW